MQENMDQVMVKYFNDLIIFDEWSSETDLYPILITRTQDMRDI